MRHLRTLLLVIIVVELSVAGSVIFSRARRPAPPLVDTGRLDPLTIADIKELTTRVADTHHPRDWKELAEALLGNGFYMAAEQCFRQSADLEPRNFHALYGRGFCLERMGFTAEAVAVLRQVTEQADPDLARTCWYQIGRCYLRQEDPVRAEAAFRRIADFPPAAYQLAKLLLREGRAEEAREIVAAPLAQAPNSLKFLQLRMRIAEALGDTVLAKELHDREDRAQYQVVLEYNQSFISMFAQRYGLAKVLAKAMQLRSAGSLRDRQVVFQQALQVIRANQLWQYRSVMLAAAHVELGMGNTDAAARLADEIETFTQTGPDVWELQAMIAETEGRDERAFELWQKVASQRPSPDVYEALAATRSTISDGRRQRFVALASLHRGIESYRSNNLSEAVKHFEAIGESLPDHPARHFYAGECHRLQGDIQAAKVSYQRCLNLNPNHGRSLRRLRLLQKGFEQTQDGKRSEKNDV